MADRPLIFTAPIAEQREAAVEAMARIIYGRWAKIEGISTSYDDMLKLCECVDGYVNLHRPAVEKAAAALAVIHEAGFAVVPREAIPAGLAISLIEMARCEHAGEPFLSTEDAVSQATCEIALAIAAADIAPKPPR